MLLPENGFFLFCPFQVFYHSRHFALLPIYAFTRIFIQWWPPYRAPPTRHEQLGVQLLHSHAQLSLTTPFSYWGRVGELSPLKVYTPGRSSDYRLQLVCLLPLGWPFKTQLDVQHVRGEARMVMLFHAAWCRPTQLCLSQVKANASRYWSQSAFLQFLSEVSAYIAGGIWVWSETLGLFLRFSKVQSCWRLWSLHAF